MPAVAARPLDYDDYVRFPNDDIRYEIVNGALHLSPSPNYFHQNASAVLFNALYSHARDHHLGVVLSAPIDVIMGPHQIVVPDIVFVSEARRDLIEKRGIMGAPDLVVEILSPSTRERDLGEKREVYEQHGVHAYWAVDLDAEAVLVFRLAEGRYGEAERETGTLTSALLPGFSLEVSNLFV
ncbi:MAG: Uma2 family endonuclease [Bacteroidota bacterium]